jgi:hypothetical protein
MSSVSLEDGYRRLLAWYPRSFRRDNGQEILAVLMASAGDGQRRPRAADAADLIAGGLRMRLRPPGRAPRTVTAAVALLCLGAVAQVMTILVDLATLGGLRAAAASASGPPQWRADLLTHPLVVICTGTAMTACWLFAAWAGRGGHDWARGVVTLLAGIWSLGLLECLSGHFAAHAPADLATILALWVLALAALVLMYTSPASRYYRPEAVRE